MATYRAFIKWVDEGFSNHRPEQVKVTVESVTTHTLTLTEANSWADSYQSQYGFSPQWRVPDIPDYTVDSSTSQSGSSSNRTYTCQITCTYNGLATTRIVGKVVFSGDTGFEQYRPEFLNVHLKRDGYVQESKIINAANSWTCTWEDLDPSYNWTVEIDTPENYQLRASQSGDTTTFNLLFVKPENREYEVRVLFDDQVPYYRIPHEVVVDLMRDDQLHSSTVFNELNGYHLFFIELSPNNSWKFEQEPLENFKTEKQVLNNTINFVNTWIGEEPNPQIGQHPTDSDYDLKYSVLYDFPTAEAALDIIHILDYGDHNSEVKPIP